MMLIICTIVLEIPKTENSEWDMRNTSSLHVYGNSVHRNSNGMFSLEACSSILPLCMFCLPYVHDLYRGTEKRLWPTLKSDVHEIFLDSTCMSSSQVKKTHPRTWISKFWCSSHRHSYWSSARRFRTESLIKQLCITFRIFIGKCVSRVCQQRASWKCFRSFRVPEQLIP